MLWFVLALISAFFTASYYALYKKMVGRMSEYVIPIFTYLIVAVIFLFISLMRGIPEIKQGFAFFLSMSSLLSATAIVLYLKALKMNDISLAIPLLSFTPVFLIVTSFFMLGEKASPYGIVGILFIVLGAYLLNFKKSKDILKPLKLFFQNKGLLYMLIVAVMFSLGANIDKIIIFKSDMFFGWGLNFLLISLIFFFVALVRKEKIKKQVKENMLLVFLSGFVLAASAISIGAAITRQIVPYVIAIKRTSILFSVIYGMIFFKEKNILQRFIAALIMFAGILLIILF